MRADASAIATFSVRHRRAGHDRLGAVEPAVCDQGLDGDRDRRGIEEPIGGRDLLPERRPPRRAARVRARSRRGPGCRRPRPGARRDVEVGGRIAAASSTRSRSSSASATATRARHSNFCARPREDRERRLGLLEREPRLPGRKRGPGAAELEQPDLHRVEGAALEPVEREVEPSGRQVDARPDVVVHGVDRDVRPATGYGLVEALGHQLEPVLLLGRARRGRSRGKVPAHVRSSAAPARLRHRDRSLGRVARVRKVEREGAHPGDPQQRHREVGRRPERLERLARELVLPKRPIRRSRSPSTPARARSGTPEPRPARPRRAARSRPGGAAPPPPGRRSSQRSRPTRHRARACSSSSRYGSTRSSSSAASSSASARSASSAAARHAGTARSGAPAPSRCRATSTGGAPPPGERSRGTLVQALPARAARCRCRRPPG